MQESAAEFSVAQGIYVETNSGWFSDRTVRYLASRQARRWCRTPASAGSCPVGDGLLAFRTLDEAAAGAERILRTTTGIAAPPERSPRSTSTRTRCWAGFWTRSASNAVYWRDVRGHCCTILLSGMIAADPHQGGATWAVLQYLLGLQPLGHDVHLSSRSGGDDPPGRHSACRIGQRRLLSRSRGGVRTRVRPALLLEAPARQSACRTRRSCNGRRPGRLLVNISGMLTDADLTGPIPTRVYLDLDPAFVQLWHAQGIDMRFDGHTHFVTIGQAIGRPDCPVPTCGRTWFTTLQPIVLADWPVADGITYNALTTVGNWRGYGSVEHEGVVYGQKAHSLRRFITLPARTGRAFPSGRRHRPRRDCWTWKLWRPTAGRSSTRGRCGHTGPTTVEFIQGSKAEFGVAKSGYVASRCGWFSDRSVCYLASGRPVIAQDTGFGNFLPTGEGLFAFLTEEDALARSMICDMAMRGTPGQRGHRRGLLRFGQSAGPTARPSGGALTPCNRAVSIGAVAIRPSRAG